MINVVILHGMRDESRKDNGTRLSDRDWIPWIKERLLERGIQAEAPELPHPDNPVYEEWIRVFEHCEVGKDTALVGHSCGAGFLVRWLGENRIRVGKVILVAPWMDPAPRSLGTGFFDFDIDPRATLRTESVTIFGAPEDDETVHVSIEKIRSAWPEAAYIELPGRGHFTKRDMGTEEFPELLRLLASNRHQIFMM